eukprot:242547-Hanusia_phi.AAC.1
MASKTPSLALRVSVGGETSELPVHHSHLACDPLEDRFYPAGVGVHLTYLVLQLRQQARVPFRSLPAQGSSSGGGGRRRDSGIIMASYGCRRGG